MSGINDGSAGVINDVISWRRHIHENPELGNEEKNTSSYVANHLASLGYSLSTGIANTGVVALLTSGRPGPTVALRADMDALPVPENTGLPFSSRNPGVSHACGHDAHTAILMGVASVLKGVRDQLPGNIKLIFQPAEEGLSDDNERGARLMIKEGALDSPRPDAIFALHADPSLEVGTVGYRKGVMLMGNDTLDIIVEGRQTHGAMPWYGVDTTVVAAQIIVGLQSIISRQVNNVETPAVITIATMDGWKARNIIPQKLEMGGLIRTFDPRSRLAIHRAVERTATMIAQSAGATARVVIGERNPVTYNEPDLMEVILPLLGKVLGKDKTIEIPVVTGSEDFSQYQKIIPGLFLMLGVKPDGVSNGVFASLHSPDFNLNESSLIHGVRTLSYMAADYLLMGERVLSMSKASKIAEISDFDISNNLKTLGVDATQFDIGLFKEGLKLKGHNIALDFDQTISDWAHGPNPPGPKKWHHHCQLKPGIVAYLAGLLRGNRLMLYTATPTSRLVHIFNAFPELKPLFKLPTGRDVTWMDVDRSAYILTRQHWAEYMVDLLDRYKSISGQGALSSEEHQIVNALLDSPPTEDKHGYPKVFAVCIKLSLIAEKLGKLPHDVLVDDSDDTRDYSTRLAPDVSFVHFKKHPPYATGDEMFEDAGGEVRDLALALTGVSTPKVYEVALHATLPPGYQVRRAIIPWSMEEYTRDFDGSGKRVAEKIREVRESLK